MIRQTRAVPAALAAALLAVAAGLTAGCSTAGRTEPAAQFVRVEANLDRATYRPGEMVVCTVTLRNVSGQPLGVSPPFTLGGSPGGANVTFRLLRFGDSEDAPDAFLARDPLGLERNPSPPAPRDLAPEEAASVRFAFVDLTPLRGRHALQVAYSGVAVDEKGTPVTGTPAAPNVGWAEFTVEGPVALRRGPAGLITEQEAIRLAGEAFGRPWRSGRAVLMETEPDSALLDWWVTLVCAPDETADVKASPRRAGYLVSPYGGFVREETEPFRVDPDKYLQQRARLKGQRRRIARPRPEATVPPSTEER